MLDLNVLISDIRELCGDEIKIESGAGVGWTISVLEPPSNDQMRGISENFLF